MTFEEQIYHLKTEIKQIDELKTDIENHDEQIIELFQIYIIFFINNRYRLKHKKPWRSYRFSGQTVKIAEFIFYRWYSDYEIKYKGKMVYKSDDKDLEVIDSQESDWLLALKTLYHTSRNTLEKDLEKERTLAEQILDRVQEIV